MIPYSWWRRIRFIPSRDEVEKLEMFVSDCLFKYIQNPDTYEIRASLYWKVRTPSSPWGSWSGETERGHVANLQLRLRH